MTGMEDAVTTGTGRAKALAAVYRALEGLDVRRTTRYTYARQIAAFINWVYTTGRELQSLGAADIVAYKEHLLSTRSTSTAATAIAAIRRLYSIVEDNGGKNIARGVHAPKVHRTFVRQHLTPAEARAVIMAAKPPRDRAIVHLLLATGIREVEAVRLDIADIAIRHIVTAGGEEVTRHVAKIWGKGRDGADAIVVIPGHAWITLARYISTRRVTSSSDPLFVGVCNRNSGGRLTTRSIRNIVTGAMRAAGLVGREYSTHSLRHTAAVAALMNGASLTDVQGMLRHSSPAITQLYVESIREELRLARAAEDKAAAYLGI